MVDEETGCPQHCCCCDTGEPCCDCGQTMPSKTCIGERCWCGEPAAKKVGEEIPFDDPFPHRHNLTSYICATHYAQIMGPLGAEQVWLAEKVKAMTEQRHDAAEVTQEDRDAAADFARDFSLNHPLFHEETRNGEHDTHPVVQTYARHREASEARWIAKLQSQEARERVARAIYPCTERAHNEQQLADAALASVVELLGEKP